VPTSAYFDNGWSDIAQQGFRVTHQAQEHCAVDTTLTAKTAHGLLEVVQRLCVAFLRRRLWNARRGDVRNELEDC
jgi:hypothetical protein